VCVVAETVKLSIVIPAYNEANRLPATVARILTFLAATPSWLPAQLIVVDDGSRDETAVCLENLVVPSGIEVTLLRLPHNLGKGAGVRVGMAASRGAWVLISDADLATPIEEVAALEQADVDVAIGSRAVDRSLIARRQPLPRDIMGRCFNLILRGLGLTAFGDTQCGFKLIEGELARRLASVMRIDGFAFDVELLARAGRLGARLAEVPVRWYHVDESRVRPLRHSAQMLRDVLRLRWWLLTGG
jgi:dolichyl-phosphate beta-glucosyltransferase